MDSHLCCLQETSFNIKTRLKVKGSRKTDYATTRQQNAESAMLLSKWASEQGKLLGTKLMLHMKSSQISEKR